MVWGEGVGGEGGGGGGGRLFIRLAGNEDGHKIFDELSQ